MSASLRLPFLLLAALSLPTAAAAQQFTVSIPDDDPATGPCSVVPFGTDGTTLTDQRYQVVVRAADLPNIPTRLRQIEFAPCAVGQRSFTTMLVTVSHLPPGQALSPVFDQNLASDAVVVLDKRNLDWDNAAADLWLRLPLDSAFPYDGSSDLVIEVIVTGAGMTMTAGGFHRGSSIERLVTPFVTEDLPEVALFQDFGGLKMQLSFFSAAVINRREESGCAGQSGNVPRLDFNFVSNNPAPGQTLLISAQDVPPNQPALFLFGLLRTNDALPFVPSCPLLVQGLLTSSDVTSSTGEVTEALSVPSDPVFTGIELLSQWAVLDAAPGGLSFATTARGATLILN